MKQQINWGIIGPGRIARGMATEWPRIQGAKLKAVASRDPARAEAFATEFGIETVHPTYEAMFGDPAIDIVYIAVPHNFHRDLCLRAIAAGKAVFCEKPMGLNATEMTAMAAAAQAKGVFLMEAVKTRFMPAMLQAQQWVREGRIGSPNLLQAHFCFDIGGDADCRHLNPDLAGGAVLDLAVYPLTVAEMLIGIDPVETLATAQMASTGVDATTAVMLRYADGAMAHLTLSVSKAAGVHARLMGPRGHIEIPFFNQPPAASLHVGAEVEKFEQGNPDSFCFEVEEANRCLRAGLLESPTMSLADSLRMARWHDAILAQIHREG